ncbi:7-carboxy-7-deazaguanine synthase QueE [Salinispora arenicola]|uniref:7-carboxy-7-deazaguanine synthase QueE n=1 Tax=Salinispora arenicola TaxID=168697 RepID=UPI00036B3779|nr:7-carboxy-7-deazaguanine synthase QueE [Salinispora arenicola]
MSTVLPTVSDRRLLVTEVFGPTFQGEGPSAGQQAMFVRLSRCNLRCPGCDTPYTWDTRRFDLREHTVTASVNEVAAQVLAAPPALVVITGGEPLLQQANVTALAERLAAAGRRVEIETNGTIVPSPELAALVERFNVSPKLPSFAADGDRPVNGDALAAFVATGRAVFKFVVSGRGDFDVIGDLADRYGLAPVWVMPEGTRSGRFVANLRALAEETLRRGWNLTGRLHVLLWEDARGR